MLRPNEVNKRGFLGERLRTRLGCPVCLEPSAIQTNDNLSICLCCSHVWQSDLSVTMLYDGFYAHQYDFRPVKQMSNLRWDFIQAHLGLSAGSNILDVGYGNGAFLKCAKLAGMAIYGIDVHSEDFGIPNITFDTHIDFDLICFFDSLEHFPEFDAIFNLSSKAVVVSVPNRPQWFLRSPSKWRHFKPGEHLHYFSPESLEHFLGRWGFETKIAEDYPEDSIRGKLAFDGQIYDNVYTAIFRE